MAQNNLHGNEKYPGTDTELVLRAYKDILVRVLEVLSIRVEFY